MRIVFILMAHLLSRLIHLMGTGGAKAVLAESLLLKHQLLVLKRKRLRAPRLTPGEGLLLGLGACFLHPRRLRRMAIILSPATLLRFHRGLRDFKYRLLYLSHPQRKPGPQGPSPELIQLISEFKQRNPGF
jgi:hypothetical protein